MERFPIIRHATQDRPIFAISRLMSSSFHLQSAGARNPAFCYNKGTEPIFMLKLTPTQIARLQKTLENLCSGNLCALDESVNSANKMLERLSVPGTEEMRREYRRILFATPNFKNLYKGVILTTELLDATVADGSTVTFPEFLQNNGQETVVKIDLGMREVPGFNGGKIVKGVETMGNDLQTYFERSGGRITAAKARQELRVGESDYIIDRGMDALAQMAAACQNFEHSILLLLEPEVVRTGTHSIEAHAETSRKALQSLDRSLTAAGVRKDLVAIKTNAVTSGEGAEVQASVDEVAATTVALWKETIDPANAIVRESKAQNAPFTVTSSFGRAAHRKPVEIWSADTANNIAAAQAQFTINAEQNELARRGEYSAENDPRR